MSQMQWAPAPKKCISEWHAPGAEKANVEADTMESIFDSFLDDTIAKCDGTRDQAKRVTCTSEVRMVLQL